MNAETPYAAAGLITLASYSAKERNWPAAGHRIILATIILIIVASASNNTVIAPLVKAVGYLVLISSVIANTPIYSKAQNASKK
jgi:hypothetical protein